MVTRGRRKTPLASCLTIETEKHSTERTAWGLQTKCHLFQFPPPCQELSEKLLSQHREDKTDKWPMIRHFNINLVTMYDTQHFWSQKISIIVHLPVMNGWLNACDTVILLSGSNTKTFSRRSLKLANIFKSSPGELVTITLISFGLMLGINLFTVCATTSNILACLVKIIYKQL